MKSVILVSLLGGAAALAGCAVAPAPVVAANGNVCGTYGYVDVNNDGFISGDEWNTYRTSSYGYWDVNHDGRVDRTEFENCYRAGGFYRSAYYNPDYWTNYWSAGAWTKIARNGNGRIDANEWVWWNG